MASLPRECCAIKRNIVANSALCENIIGGAYDLRVACYNNVCYSQVPCSQSSPSAVTGQEPGYIDWITTSDQTPPCQVWALCEGGSPADEFVDESLMEPYFYRVSVRDKTLEHTWALTYDYENGSLGNSESINFQVDVKDKDFYCTVKDYIGQEVIVVFREKGSDRWYLVGYTGGLVFTNISGGTGTDTFTPTSFEITSTNSTDIFMQILVPNPHACSPTSNPLALLTDAEYTTYLLDAITN